MTKTKFEAMDILNKDDIPCGPILSMKEIIEDQSLRATGTVVEVDHPDPRQVFFGRQSDQDVGQPERGDPSPLLGEHTDEILRQVLGFSTTRSPRSTIPARSTRRASRRRSKRRFP
jgi:Predicted acyl-CoA transferases/carnitine dehydratase